ncbi:MAG: hypothetical protein ACLQVI_12465 [Polyangiaceae bacterium]|jgi:hypothetical protein
MSLSTPTWLPRFALVASIPALVIACSSSSSSTGFASASGGEVPTATPPGEDGGPSEYPILAPIDTGANMTAAPGQGVGVFTEYYTGGQWHVWWTCDSLVDSQNPPCQFDVKISVASGTITDPVSQGFQASDTFTVSGAQIEGVTTTSTASDGVTFDTAPGAVITLSATVGGQYDGRFLFFVEGGKVDDGFTGTVTDPIMLQGATP